MNAIFTVSIEPETLRAFDDALKADGLTRSETIRALIEYWLSERSAQHIQFETMKSRDNK